MTSYRCDRRVPAWVVPTAIAALVFMTNLGGSYLWDDDEPKNAGCGREMFEQRNWTTPTFNGELRPHKPILLYWAMISSYAAFGVDEFSARLPSALAGVVTVALCAQLGALLFERSVGALAGALLASSLLFAALSRAATPDGLLMLLVTATFYCYVRGSAWIQARPSAMGEPGPSAHALDCQTPMKLETKWCVGMYACMGLAALAKGPIGVLLPGIALTAFLLSCDALQANPREGQRRAAFRAACRPRSVVAALQRLRLPLGVLVVAGVAVPWYLSVTIATDGAWLRGFLGTHNVHRFLQPMEGHRGGPWYYPVAIMAGFFPASCFLPVAIARACGAATAADRPCRGAGLLLSWIGAYLAVFTLAATKLPNYVAPCYPALALATAGWLVQAVRSPAAHRRWMAAGIGGFVVAAAVLGAGLWGAAASRLGGDATLAIVALPAIGGGTLGWALWRRSCARGALTALVAGSVLMTCCAVTWTGPRVSRFQDSRRIAEAMLRLRAGADADAPLASLQYTKPNLVFYCGEPVRALPDPDAAIDLWGREPSALIAMPRETYDQLRDRGPADLRPLAVESRFFGKQRQVLVVGRVPQLALRVDPVGTSRR